MRALQILEQLRAMPLRTFDALHLAIAQSLAVPVLATAACGLARAAEALGITAVTFG